MRVRNPNPQRLHKSSFHVYWPFVQVTRRMLFIFCGFIERSGLMPLCFCAGLLVEIIMLYGNITFAYLRIFKVKYSDYK
jgi:hypothetical protein